MTPSERIAELIKERDDAREELLRYKKAYAWICEVCKYPMDRLGEHRWHCRFCQGVAENNVLKDRLNEL